MNCRICARRPSKKTPNQSDNDVQHDADDDAGDDGKVKATPVLPRHPDVAGQSSQPAQPVAKQPDEQPDQHQSRPGQCDVFTNGRIHTDITQREADKFCLITGVRVGYAGGGAGEPVRAGHPCRFVPVRNAGKHHNKLSTSR